MMTDAECRERLGEMLRWENVPSRRDAIAHALACGWQYTALPDGSVQVGTWPDDAPTGEAA
jgi:hypothetical protein